MASQQFQNAYQISPILLTGGVAASYPGGQLPIVNLLQPGNFGGLGGLALDDPLDEFFAQFIPLPGSKLISNKYGQYPFANQSVAANALIVDPLNISLLMLCPVREGGYPQKQSIITALRATLTQHGQMGGSYTVMTPAFPYTDCVLLDLTDVSGGEDKQVQHTYRWDFWRPLITLTQAAAAYGSLINKIDSGLPTDGMTSGPSNTIGFPPSGATPSSTPSAQNLPGAINTGNANPFGAGNANVPFSQSPLQ